MTAAPADREVALLHTSDLACQLSGDTAVLPITAAGALDLDALYRDGCLAPSDPDASQDPARLGVIIDSFTSLIKDAPEGIRVAVLGSKVVQWDGEPFPAAVELVERALRDGTDLERERRARRPLPAWLDRTRALRAAATGGLPIIDPTVWQGHPVPARAWWLPDLVPARTVTLLTGDGGTGKSLLALQLAVASALGASTADLEPAAGRVLYVAAEDEADEFQRRLADILASHHCDFADLAGQLRLVPLADRDATLMAPDQKGRMAGTPLLDSLTAVILEFQPSLVVLDTSADLFGGDEIKRQQVRAFVAALRQLALAADCAVLLLSHPSVAGMASGAGTSGSTAWSNSVRSRLYLSRPTGDDADPDARDLKVMKANYGSTGDVVRLRWQEGLFVRDDPAATAMAVGFVEQRHDAKFIELLAAMNRTGQRVAPTKGVNYAPSVIETHPSAGGLSKKQLEAAMRRLLASGDIRVMMDGPPSKQRQRLVVSSAYFGP